MGLQEAHGVLGIVAPPVCAHGLLGLRGPLVVVLLEGLGGGPRGLEVARQYVEEQAVVRGALHV